MRPDGQRQGLIHNPQLPPGLVTKTNLRHLESQNAAGSNCEGVADPADMKAESLRDKVKGLLVSDFRSRVKKDDKVST
jgi:hypothetical protein